ncbi:dynamin family protein [Actinomycetospora sp. NBC_00405]|uniref:dynamin family protein n=1 Tax=Actinomycetospora sp. NBC_00405 TaxID=2975952 RepID=UPI002E226A50
MRGLVRHVAGLYQGGPAAAGLDRAARRLDEPLRVAIAGRIKAGKSTLLNAMVGQELAATDAGECTRIVTWFRDGHTYRVQAQLRDGSRRQLPPGPTGGLLDIDLGRLGSGDVDRLLVDWPSPALRLMTLIDTPGLDSLSAELSRKTEAALAPGGDGAAEADAVIYLMRHVHASDVHFLEAFRDDPTDRRPLNTIGILARADEVGHARPDALESAASIAARYREDERIRGLCQTVIPVAGLLASSAVTLREDEFRAFGVLATAPEADVDRLLLTASRFARAESEVGLEPARRAALLDRYGLYGLRLCVRLLREGTVTTAGGLSRELITRSGLGPLRESLMTRLAGRADVLRAQSALTAVERAVRRYPIASASALRGEIEQITAGAHEFAEIRLLDRLHTGAVTLAEDERADAERLLGSDGPGPAIRLGLTLDARPEEVVRAANASLGRWRRRGEHPASGRDVRDAARVLARTCEGILQRAQRSGPPGRAVG